MSDYYDYPPPMEMEKPTVPPKPKNAVENPNMISELKQKLFNRSQSQNISGVQSSQQSKLPPREVLRSEELSTSELLQNFSQPQTENVPQNANLSSSFYHTQATYQQPESNAPDFANPQVAAPLNFPQNAHPHHTVYQTATEPTVYPLLLDPQSTAGMTYAPQAAGPLLNTNPQPNIYPAHSMSALSAPQFTNQPQTAPPLEVFKNPMGSHTPQDALLMTTANQPLQGYQPATAPSQAYEPANANLQGYQQSTVPPQGHQPVNPRPQGYQQGTAPPHAYQPVNPRPQGYQQGTAPPHAYQPVNPRPQGYQQGTVPPHAYQPVNSPPQGYQQGTAPPQAYQLVNPPPQGYQQGTVSPQAYQPTNPPLQGYQQRTAPPQDNQQASAAPQVYQTAKDLAGTFPLLNSHQPPAATGYQSKTVYGQHMTTGAHFSHMPSHISATVPVPTQLAHTHAHSQFHQESNLNEQCTCQIGTTHLPQPSQQRPRPEAPFPTRQTSQVQANAHQQPIPNPEAKMTYMSSQASNVIPQPTPHAKHNFPFANQNFTGSSHASHHHSQQETPTQNFSRYQNFTNIQEVHYPNYPDTLGHSRNQSSTHWDTVRNHREDKLHKVVNQAMENPPQVGQIPARITPLYFPPKDGFNRSHQLSQFEQEGIPPQHTLQHAAGAQWEGIDRFRKLTPEQSIHEVENPVKNIKGSRMPKMKERADSNPKAVPRQKKALTENSSVINTIEELKSLGSFKEMLDTSKTYKTIVKYAYNSVDSNYQVEVHDIYEIKGKAKVAQQLANNAMLLWFKTTPESLAKMIAKRDHSTVFYDRLQPAVEFGEDSVPLRQLILLCAVDLGKVLESQKGVDCWTTEEIPLGSDTVKGLGRLFPDENGDRDDNSVRIPCGKTKKVKASKNKLKYNEFILHEIRRAQVRYAVDLELFPVDEENFID